MESIHTTRFRQIAAATSIGQPAPAGDSGQGNWFEAMARAWGETLDQTAARLSVLSDRVSNGDDSPAAVTTLSSESLRMNFLSSSAHTSISSVGGALETMARKQ